MARSQSTDGELNQETMEREVRSMEKSVAQYNVLEQLGSTPSEREDGAMRMLVCQMREMTSPEVRVRAIKIAATERLIKKYNILNNTFMELT